MSARGPRPTCPRTDKSCDEQFIWGWDEGFETGVTWAESGSMTDPKPADPAPADGDLVRRLAEIIDAARVHLWENDRIARAVLAEMAKSDRPPWETIADQEHQELVSARQTIAALEADVRTRVDDQLTLTETIARLEAELTEGHKLRCDYERDLAVVTRERDELKGVVVGLQSGLRDTRASEDALLRQVDSLTRELAEAREELAATKQRELEKGWELDEALDTIKRHEAALATIDAHRARQKPDSGGERACVADEGVPDRFGYIEFPDPHTGEPRYRRAQPAPQAEAALLLGPTAPLEKRLAELESTVAELWRLAREGVNGGNE